MRLKILPILVIFLNAFAFVPSVWNENPAFIYESPRKHIDLLEFQSSIFMDQNFLTMEDVTNLVKGEKIVLDKSRLDLIGDFAVFNPDISIADRMWIGIGSFRLGMSAFLDSDVSFEFPRDLVRVIFGDVDLNERIDGEEFHIFEGGIVAKGGLTLGIGFGKYRIAVDVGTYLPILWFDENSKVSFYYLSDEETASLKAGIDGDVKVYTVLSSFEENTSVDGEPGVYMDIGVLADYGKLKLAISANSISLAPSKLYNYGFASVSFEASYSNLKFNMSGPDLELPEKLERSTEPINVSLPMEINAFASYKVWIFNFGAKVNYIPDESVRYGFNVDVLNFLWIDFENLGSAWRKSVGLNVYIKVMRITAEVGVIDYGDLFNTDPSKMTGLYLSMGLGFGF